MPVRLLPWAIAASIVGTIAACHADSISSPSSPISARVVGENAPAQYDFHAGDAFLQALNPAFGPDLALAPNGDKVILTGTGTLSIHPKSATGGGTFTHLSPTGDELATGTWSATDLLSFVSYGPSAATPPSFRAGQALIRIQLHPAGAASAVAAILRIECRLPGSVVPGGIEEGINLVVPGVANFNEQAGGNTVFVLK
jgi:hypothetical protein